MGHAPFHDLFTRRRAVQGIGLSGLAVALTARNLAAQEATPASGTGPAGLLGRYESSIAPGQALSLQRIVLPPGAVVPPHLHPGETVWHLESGRVGFTLLAGGALMVRAADGVPSAATPAAVEGAVVGVEIELGAGDTLYFDGSALQTERNLGDEPAAVLVANLRRLDEPLRMEPPVGADATPAG